MANKVSLGHAPLTVIPMTAREVRFANHYLEHGNKTAAARHAGYQGSDPVLCQTGTNLLKKNEVIEYIRRGIDVFMETECITRQMVASSLGRDAFADRTRIFDEDVLPPSEWPDDVKGTLLSYEAKTTTARVTGDITRHVKVRFVSAVEAKRILAEFIGMIGPKAAFMKNENAAGGIKVILEAADGTQTEFPDDGFPLEVPAAG